MIVLIGIVITISLYFWLFYLFQKRLFKILCASINEYLGNQFEYYFKKYDKPDEFKGDGKDSRISETWNHDDIEDIF